MDPTRPIPTEMARLAREAFGILGRYDGEVRINMHPTPDVEPWAMSVGMTVYGHPELSRPKHRHLVPGGLEPACIWPNIMGAAALASDRPVPKAIAGGLAAGVLAAACVPTRSGVVRVAVGGVAAALGFDVGARMATARADATIVDALAGSKRIDELVRYIEHLRMERPTVGMNTILLPRLTKCERSVRARERLASMWGLEIVGEPKESRLDMPLPMREDGPSTRRPTHP